MTKAEPLWYSLLRDLQAFAKVARQCTKGGTVWHDVIANETQWKRFAKIVCTCQEILQSAVLATFCRHPALTTVRQLLGEMGRHAASLLVQSIGKSLAEAERVHLSAECILFSPLVVALLLLQATDPGPFTDGRSVPPLPLSSMSRIRPWQYANRSRSTSAFARPYRCEDQTPGDVQANKPPDIFQNRGGGVLFQFAKAGQVQDITSALQGTTRRNSFSSSALNAYVQNGRNYGVPWDIGAVGVWYNPSLFTKAGISAPPTTRDDFLTEVFEAWMFQEAKRHVLLTTQQQQQAYWLSLGNEL